jgi:16S rRNA (guanine966-N2)-methyltransferase
MRFYQYDLAETMKRNLRSSGPDSRRGLANNHGGLRAVSRESHGANVVRIGGGAWRRRLIRFPDSGYIRPTPARVRETVFNWLGQELHGRRCLDLFAGSGALGFEAASRGAEEVVLVERDPLVCSGLRESAEILKAHQVRVWSGDALEFLTQDQSRFDVVFIDPPFADGITEALMAAVVSRMAGAGLTFVESGGQIPEFPGWQVIRSGRAGAVHFQLLALDE